MHLLQIIESITKGIEQNRTLLSVLQEAYDTTEQKKLLKMRAHTVMHLESVLSQTEHDEEMERVVGAMITILSYPYLGDSAQKAGVVWSSVHNLAIKMLIERHSDSQGVRILLEIEEILDEIRGLDVDEKQREFLSELFSAIDTFGNLYEIEGSRAYKRLFFMVAGLFGLYEESLRDASPTMRKKLKQIMEAIIKANQVSDAFVKIENRINEGIQYLQNF